MFMKMSGILIDINSQIIGYGKSIVASLIPPENMTERKECPCYFCGGKTRARWIAEKEILFCNQGCNGKKGKTAIDVVMIVLNCNFKDAATWIRNQLGVLPMPTPEPPENMEAKKECLKHILSTLTNAQGTLTERYLANRGLEVPEFGVYHSKGIGYWNPKTNMHEGDFKPAMVAPIRKGKETIGLHITYLTPDGKKERQKNDFMIDELTGGWIAFSKTATEQLAIAEGMETALSVNQEYMDCRCVLNANNLEKYTPPAWVKMLIAFSDMDNGNRSTREQAEADKVKSPSFTGQKAVYTLLNRLATSKEYSQLQMGSGLIINGKLILDMSGAGSIDFNDFIRL